MLLSSNASVPTRAALGVHGWAAQWPCSCSLDTTQSIPGKDRPDTVHSALMQLSVYGEDGNASAAKTPAKKRKAADVAPPSGDDPDWKVRMHGRYLKVWAVHGPWLCRPCYCMHAA